VRGTQAEGVRNKVLRKIFGPKWDEVTGDWRRLRNEEHYDLYQSQNIIQLIKSRTDAYRVLVGRPEGERLLGKSRPRWEDNIKMDLQGVGWVIECIDLYEDRDRWRAVVNAVMNLRVP
jgi:hypothetical protein